MISDLPVIRSWMESNQLEYYQISLLLVDPQVEHCTIALPRTMLSLWAARPIIESGYKQHNKHILYVCWVV